MKKSPLIFGFIGLIVSLLATSCQQDSNNTANTEQISSENITVDVCPQSDMTPEKIKIGNEDASEFVDLNREVKDFGTNFIVKEFFRTQDTLFNFMKIVYETIDQKLAEYRKKHDLEEKAVFFIFKGGNVLRIIANKFFSMIPPEARDLLKENYAANFKRSDADFGVFIDANRLRGKDYEETLNELTALTYDALGELRTEFTANPEKYFNFKQLKEKVATGDLDKYFQKLDQLEVLKDPENSNWFGAQFAQFQLGSDRANATPNCQYVGQLDYRYEFDPESPKKIIGIPLTTSTSWIMNTVNRTLEWGIESAPDKLVKFHLVRAKAQFEYTFMKDNVLYRKPIGGELVDVSFAHKDDFRLQSFLDHYDEWIANYTVSYPETEESLSMKAESMEGLAADIHEILFKQFPRPWEATKYEKRISRLFFLAIIEMAGSYGFGSEKVKDLLTSVKEKIIAPLKGLYPLKGEESIKLVEEIKAEAARFAADVPTMKISGDILQAIGAAPDQLIKEPKEDDAENFSEFVNLVEKNLDIMITMSEMPEVIIDPKEVYKATMDLIL